MSAPDGTHVTPEAFRDALARWASGVTLVAARDEGRVHATTVSAFLSVSVEPPLVLVSLGAGAQVLPFLAPGQRFGVSVLGAHQARLASVFADAYPVGPSPFAEEGDPVVPDAPVRLGCRVTTVERAGDHWLVLAAVEDAATGPGDPLVRFARAYHRLREE